MGIYKESKKLATAYKVLMIELGKGAEALGASIRKSGLFVHLMVLWCLVWGAIGVLLTLGYLINRMQ